VHLADGHLRPASVCVRFPTRGYVSIVHGGSSRPAVHASQPS